MNSRQLACIGECLLKLKLNFLGVFAQDNLPEIKRYPSCLIANIDDSYSPGRHWIAVVYLSPKNTEFFDSIALPPMTYGFNLPNARTIPYRLQGLTSNVCGHYCLCFLYYRSQGYSLSKFYQLFSSSDHNWNDLQVRSFVSRAKRASTKCFSCECPCDQGCCTFII